MVRRLIEDQEVRLRKHKFREGNTSSLTAAQIPDPLKHIVTGEDPDSDRIGVALRNKKGEYVLLNGNQTLVLLLSYQLTRWAERGELDGNQYVVKTIVTSQMANAVADFFKV